MTDSQRQSATNDKPVREMLEPRWLRMNEPAYSMTIRFVNYSVLAGILSVTARTVVLLANSGRACHKQLFAPATTLPELVVGLSFPRTLASYQSLSCFFVAMTLPELVVGLSFPRPLASCQSLSCCFVAMTLPELVVRLSFPRSLACYQLGEVHDVR